MSQNANIAAGLIALRSFANADKQIDKGLRGLIEVGMLEAGFTVSGDVYVRPAGEPKDAVKRVSKYFDGLRAAIVEGLSKADREKWDSYKDQKIGDRVAKAREQRRKDALAGNLSAGIVAAVSQIENSLTYGPKVRKVVEAALVSDDVLAVAGKVRMDAAKPTYAVALAGDVLDGSKGSTENGAGAGEGETGDGAEPGAGEDSPEAIIANAVTRLRKIGRDDLADAIGNAVAALATVAAK